MSLKKFLQFFSSSFSKGDFCGFFISLYVIQHCFFYRPSDSTVSKDAGIEPRTVTTLALTARRSKHSARSRPQFKILSKILKKLFIIRNNGYISIIKSAQIKTDTGPQYKLKGTVRPDWICMRVVSLESPLKAHQPL
jgi:hypothetical protein